MRNITRKLLTIVAVLALAIAVCGDDDTTTDDTTTDDTTTDDTTTDDTTTDDTTTDDTTTDDTTTDDTTTDDTTTDTATDEELTVDLYLLPESTGDDCSVTEVVSRTTTGAADVEDALTLLLAGPTADDEANGLTSWFSAETAGLLNEVTVTDGLAEVDFSDFSQIIPNASSSCGSTSLLAQLDGTVLQFDDIDEVVYSFDGSRPAFYEWLQLEAPA